MTLRNNFSHMFNQRCNDNIDGPNKIITHKSYLASSSNSTLTFNANVVQIDERSQP